MFIMKNGSVLTSVEVLKGQTIEEAVCPVARRLSLVHPNCEIKVCRCDNGVMMYTSFYNGVELTGKSRSVSFLDCKSPLTPPRREEDWEPLRRVPQFA